MVDWNTLNDVLDAAVDTHLRVQALLRPASGGPDLPIRVHLELPEDIQIMTTAGLVRPRPWIEVSVLLVPRLVNGDAVLIGEAAPYEGWKVAATPTRPGDGRHWRTDVSPLGPILA